MGRDDPHESASIEWLQRVLGERTELWDVFTRREEYEPALRDKYDRYPSFLSRGADHFQPYVSALLHQLGVRPEYPDDKEFAVCLSHDVDFLFETPEAKLNKAVNAFASKDLGGMLKHIRQMPKTRIPYWTFDEIMRMEDRHGARSTFFFLANDSSEPEANYLPEDVRSVMAELDAGGWEIGLHGGFRAYMDIERLKLEKGLLERALGRSVSGYRGHFLKFRVPDTWELLARAGFAYDSTLGYPDRSGFRNGMCHPYRPFNLRTSSWIDILEVPLVIMDTSLFEHMRLDAKQAWDLTSTLLRRVRELAGGISINWHNSSFSGEPLDFYERILQFCNENEAWMTTCGRLAEHWRLAGYLR